LCLYYLVSAKPLPGSSAKALNQAVLEYNSDGFQAAIRK